MNSVAHLSRARQLSYCLLHGWPSTLARRRSDVDIAIAPGDLPQLERALGSSNGGRVVQLLQHEASGYYFVLATRHGTAAEFVAVDAAVDYRRDGYIFFTADELLAGRRPLEDLWVAAPATEFAYLLVKKVSKGALPEHQKARLRSLAGSLGEEACAVARRTFGTAWGNRVMEWLRRSDWAALEACLPRLRRALRWQVIARNPLNPVRYWLPELKRRWQRWRYPTGLWVAVLGSDGAGKTTFISHLKPRLAEVFRRTAAFHLSPTLRERAKSQSAATDPHGKAPRSRWLSWLKVPYHVAVYAFGYFFAVRPRLTRSTLVLFDRYYDDRLVDPHRYRDQGSVKLASLGRHLVPMPDLYFILDAPEEQLLQRKQEVSAEELRRQRQAYRCLVTDRPGAILLDGSLPPDEAARHGADVILDYLHNRYVSRRSLWFHRGAGDALDWLASIVCSSSEHGYARRARGRQRHQEPDGATRRTFTYLPLRDGRGYLFPLGPRRARVKALELYNTQSRKARIAKGLLAASLRLGIGERLFPRVELVQRVVPGKLKPSASFLEHLEHVLGQGGLNFAISLGTPGHHRKPVFLVLTREGEALAYAKLGSDDATNALLEHEAEVLRRLARATFRSFATPRVLHAGWWNGRYLCVQSVPTGRTARAPLDLNHQYVDVTRELADFQTRCLPLGETDLWKGLLQRAETSSNAWYGHALERGLRKAEDWTHGARLPFRLSHGDFVPWNAKREAGRLLIFDWEYATENGVPAGDVFHFLFQTMLLVQRRSPAEVLEALLAAGPLRAKVEGCFTGLNLHDIPQDVCLLLYCLQRLSSNAANARGPATQHEMRALANWLHTL